MENPESEKWNDGWEWFENWPDEAAAVVAGF